MACFWILHWIIRAVKHSLGTTQGWLANQSHKNEVANMEIKDRKPPLDKTSALTLFVKEQKEVGNRQASLGLWQEGILRLGKIIMPKFSRKTKGLI